MNDLKILDNTWGIIKQDLLSRQDSLSEYCSKQELHRNGKLNSLSTFLIVPLFLGKII